MLPQPVPQNGILSATGTFIIPPASNPALGPGGFPVRRADHTPPNVLPTGVTVREALARAWVLHPNNYIPFFTEAECLLHAVSEARRIVYESLRRTSSAARRAEIDRQYETLREGLSHATINPNPTVHKSAWTLYDWWQIYSRLNGFLKIMCGPGSQDMQIYRVFLRGLEEVIREADERNPPRINELMFYQITWDIVGAALEAKDDPYDP
jgi:hypothetical protein